MLQKKYLPLVLAIHPGLIIFKYESNDRKESSEAGFDTPARYIYEFFHHPDYLEFKSLYKHYLPTQEVSEKDVRYVRLGHHDPQKKLLFFELENTFVLLSHECLDDLPYYCYVGKKIARRFGMTDFYVYLRPFTLWFLNIINEVYELAVYSSLDKQLVIFLLDIIQKDKEYFNMCITHSTDSEPKSINKFLKEGRSLKNSLLIDCDPEVIAYNSNWSLPLPKFKGNPKDSTLLYLQKYVMEELREHDDLSIAINEFHKKIAS